MWKLHCLAQRLGALSRHVLINVQHQRPFSTDSKVHLILMRHGQSRWNARNRFTGWTDVALTPQGEQEAWAAGRILRSHRLAVVHAFTSELSRAQRTTQLVLESLDQGPPVSASWRLNERHYGGLTGLHKTETMERWGAEKVMAMRRGTARPPPMERSHPMWKHVMRDKEHLVESGEVPLSESLPETRERVWEYWRTHILPKLRDIMAASKQQPLSHPRAVIVVSHLHAIRLLIAELDGLSQQELLALDVPTAVPLLYDLDRLRLEFHGEPCGLDSSTKRQITGSNSPVVDLVRGRWLGETALPSMRVTAIRSLLLRRRGLLFELLPYLPQPIQSIFVDGTAFKQRAMDEAARSVGRRALTEQMCEVGYVKEPHLRPRDQVVALHSLYARRPWISMVDDRFCDACARALHAVSDDINAPPRRKYDGLRSGWASAPRAPPPRAAVKKLDSALNVEGTYLPEQLVKLDDFAAFARLAAVAAYLAWIQKNGAEFLPEKEYKFAVDVAKTGLLSEAEIKADLAPADHKVYSAQRAASATTPIGQQQKQQHQQQGQDGGGGPSRGAASSSAASSLQQQAGSSASCLAQ